MASSDLIAELIAGLRPVIAQAVNAAVAEALKRAVTVEAIEGTCEAVTGRTADVNIPGNTSLIPATVLSTAITAGDSVIVFFYGAGRAYAAGPLPLP